jgi:hypothetical protein
MERLKEYIEYFKTRSVHGIDKDECLDYLIEAFINACLLREYEDLGSVKELAEPVRAKTEGRLVELPDTGIGDLSDGYHTFHELYHQRAVLFAVICNLYKDKAWKSLKHHDGTMFDGGYFIVGVETPQGQYTYHYKLDHWDLYDVKELESAPEWDGHTADDAGRLLSLTCVEDLGPIEELETRKTCMYIQQDEDSEHWQCNVCNADWAFPDGSPKENGMKFCPVCGRKIEKITYREYDYDKCERVDRVVMVSHEGQAANASK